MSTTLISFAGCVLRPRRAWLATRHIIAALLAARLFTAAAAEPVAIPPTLHSSLQSATAAAAADQSLVLLIFGAEWCGPCKLLKSKTLSAPEFSRQESALHFVEIDIDANQKMAHSFAVEAVPTIVLLTADGKIIARQTGFQEIGTLLGWLQEGRRRAAAGQWEGTVPGSQLEIFVQKAAADRLGTNDLQRLVELLGEPDPADRESAAKILLAQREPAVPLLIEAVGHPYLGERIAANELLLRLAPGLTPADPWQSPFELSNTVVVLRKWWAETGKLPELGSPPPVAAFANNSIKEALEQLRSDDPMRRTAAMTTLASRGPEALPAVREAIKRAAGTGDQRALGLLEDVRWTILLPDALAERSGGARNALARGKSSERQAAAERLGNLGREALGPLTELASDTDPLVVESAVRALAGLGGNEAIPALAALLQVADNNVRITAAQALGHTKNAAAVKPLLTVINDPNEVVACTALSALEETQARESYRSAREKTPEEIVAGLKSCLTDPRWRVRAAAAEIIGKLSLTTLADDLKPLLADPDGFVVKSALTALGNLNATPESGQLVALSKRLPSLQGDAVEMLLRSPAEETVKTVTDLFNSGTVSERIAVLNALVKRGGSHESKSAGEWKPLLMQAITAADPRLRRSAAEALGQQPLKLGVELVGQLLADEDRETRLAAADVVLRLLDLELNESKSTAFEFPVSATAAPAKTNKPAATAAKIAGWHAAMLQHEEPASDLCLAAALFVTGDGKTDLPLLLRALDKTNELSGQTRSQIELKVYAIGLVVQKLSLSEGRQVLDKLAASPSLFAQAVSQSGRSKAEVLDYLLEPARFKAALEPAEGASLTGALELLAGYDYDFDSRPKWSLWHENPRTKAVALALLDSTNAAWRAAAVFSLGLRADSAGSTPAFTRAIADLSPWVRASAIKAIARQTKDRPTLEQQLAPLLTDTNLTVAVAAAASLLEPEVRQAAGLEGEFDYFEFETSRGGRSMSSRQSDERPLMTLAAKPAQLQAAKAWLTNSTAESVATFAVLLAQYGEFDGVDRLVAQLAAQPAEKEPGESATEAVLTGIALSHDVKYLPFLRQIAASRQEESELRKVLQAMKGMAGPEVRQLRLIINKKIRGASGSRNMID